MSMTKIRGLQPPPINLAPRVAPVASLVSPLGSLHQRTGGALPYRWVSGSPPRILLTARGKICNNPELQPAEQHGRDMEVTHRLSNSQSRTTSSRAQSTLQIADKLVSPGLILFSQRNRPPGLRPSHVRTVSDDMDRRHPSSFQQLEKVCLHWTYQTES
jgi:hypothetical protein